MRSVPPSNVVDDSLDVLVRMHDFGRAFELRRALFSLVCQAFRPINIHVITQRFSPSDVRRTSELLESILEVDRSVCGFVWNYTKPQPSDARSALLNLGIEKAKGRYLAILDHDDTIYPHAYPTLIQELTETNTAVAFGGAVVKEAEVFQDTILVKRRFRKFTGISLIDLFDDNFCPIHSFVLNRSLIESDDLSFDVRLSKLEDYDFLLRLCAKYSASFRKVDSEICDYYFKTDGSNTIRVGPAVSAEREAAWLAASKQIEQRRRASVLSPVVQKELGFVPPQPDMTIRRVLKLFHSRHL